MGHSFEPRRMAHPPNTGSGGRFCGCPRGLEVTMRAWPGSTHPLGATYDGAGTNFALFSEVADHVVLCLIDASGHESRVRLPEMDGFVHHGYLPDVGPGQRYGYRVYGPHDPPAGKRCNPAKLLLDPYAKAIDGDVDWDWSLFGYDIDDPSQQHQQRR